MIQWLMNHGYYSRKKEDILRLLSSVSVSVSTMKQYVAAAVELWREQQHIEKARTIEKPGSKLISALIRVLKVMYKTAFLKLRS